jgi:exopolysaccharide biosynthesis polyprenyl glycosylphosphotransferase
MQKKSELFFNLILLPIDFIAIIGAFTLAYIIRVKLEARPVPNPLGAILFLKIFLVIVPVWILIFAVTGLYSQTSLRGRLEELGKIFVAVSGGTMFVVMVDFVSRQPVFPAKAIPFYGYGISLVLVTAGRQVVRAVQRSLFRIGVGVHRAVLIGSGEIAQRIEADLKETSKSGYQIVAAVDSAAGASKRLPDLKVYKRFKQFLSGEKTSDLDEIIQADSALEAEEVLELVNYASNHHLVYRFVPNQFGLYATNSVMSTLAGVPVIAIKQTPLDGWGRIIKRTFDLAGATIGMILLLPLFMAIAVAIKAADPAGPVFYRHKRLSRNGQIIYLWKFRTMYEKYCNGEGRTYTSAIEVFKGMGRPDLIEEWKADQKLRLDPRVHPAGRFLRSCSLDELPQLLNILAGDLSLVGPRPITEEELGRYGDVGSIFLALKPGLTGLWQISGRNDIGYGERVKLDIYYVENWSLWLDVKILLKTIAVLVRRTGAY